MQNARSDLKKKCIKLKSLWNWNWKSYYIKLFYVKKSISM